MPIHLICIGKLKRSAEYDLCADYQQRCDKASRSLGYGALKISELPESRAASSSQRKAEEAHAIADKVQGGDYLIVLDEKQKSEDSIAFSKNIQQQLDAGRPICLVIGGPDGLSPDLVKRANQGLSFGAMTWPHRLVRVMALEQIYRALTIMSGHPYHRV